MVRHIRQAIQIVIGILIIGFACAKAIKTKAPDLLNFPHHKSILAVRPATIDEIVGIRQTVQIVVNRELRRLASTPSLIHPATPNIFICHRI